MTSAAETEKVQTRVWDTAGNHQSTAEVDPAAPILPGENLRSFLDRRGVSRDDERRLLFERCEVSPACPCLPCVVRAKFRGIRRHSVKDVPRIEREVIDAVMACDEAWETFTAAAAAGESTDEQYRAAMAASQWRQHAVSRLKRARLLVATGH